MRERLRKHEEEMRGGIVRREGEGRGGEGERKERIKTEYKKLRMSTLAVKGKMWWKIG